jgi:hypothetical protein
VAKFIDIEIETDPDALTLEQLEYLEANIPDFDASEGNLELWILRGGSRIAASIRDMIGDVPAAIFRKFGTDLLNLPPDENTPATITVDITFVDDGSYEIPAGTLVGVDNGSGVEFPFQFPYDLSVEHDALVDPSVIEGAILEAVLEEGAGGASGNGLNGTVTMVDGLDFIASIVVAVASSGGVDAETDEAYLDRLRTRLQLLSPRPILPRDFAIMAQDVDGVDRAVAIDLYNPSDIGTDYDRTVSIASIDTNGDPVSVGIKANVVAYLESEREVNFNVYAIDPTYTTISFVYVGVCRPDADPAVVEAAIDAMLTDYVSPANWGRPSFGDAREWQLDDKVRYFEVITAINNVDGFDHLTSLTINGGTTDVTLTGAAPLPELGTITSTVSAP